MSKAILVMDMPDRCSECQLCLKITQKNGLALCLGVKGNKSTEYNPKKISGWFPDWCPLKPFPEKANHPDFCDGGRYDKGYNDCLDEIYRGD